MSAREAVGDLQLADGVVLGDGRVLELTTYEYRVLECLMLAGANAVRSKAQIEHAIYGDGARPISSNVIEVLVGRIRKCLRAAQVQVQIDTLRNRGYMLSVVR